MTKVLQMGMMYLCHCTGYGVETFEVLPWLLLPCSNFIDDFYLAAKADQPESTLF